MKKNLYILLLAAVCSITNCMQLWAIKATANIVKYKQPDGTVISLKVSGDEFLGYNRTLDGYIVCTGKDGYLYYADYNNGFLQLSGVRVNGASPAVKGAATHSVVKVSGVPSAIKYSLRSNAVQEIAPRSGASVASGTGKSLVLLVEFADTPFTLPDVENHFNTLLNHEGSNYFNDNFRGTRTFSFDLSPIVTLSENVAHYGEHTAYLNDANVAGMVIEACKIASGKGIDFSQYDTDKDGLVDNVAIIFAGLNEAESGVSSAIWPHKGDISDQNIFCNGVKIASYTCSSEYSGDNTDYRPATIGSFCHEYAHYLGLVDLYDVNKEEEGLSNALYGRLSLMDEGNYLNKGETPPYFNAIEREMLGLAEMSVLKVDRKYQLVPVQDADTLYRIETANNGEYFLLECRSNEGWDSHLGGAGLVLYHIDKSETLCGGVTASARWRLNIVNSYAEHECAKVLVPDQARSSANDVGHIFYPGLSGITSLTASGNPSLTDWQHAGVGISINDIGYSNGIVHFAVKEDLVYSDTISCAKNFNITPYQNHAFMQWESSVENFEGKGNWFVMLNDESGEGKKVILPADSTCFLFEKLEPAKRYEGKIYFVENNRMGEVHSFSFETEEITSVYPYIRFLGGYGVGDMLNLCVQNLVEAYTSLEFRINGEELPGMSYKFKEAGEYIVEAIIKYPDNSFDIITKKLVVR